MVLKKKETGSKSGFDGMLSFREEKKKKEKIKE